MCFQNVLSAVLKQVGLKVLRLRICPTPPKQAIPCSRIAIFPKNMIAPRLLNRLEILGIVFTDFKIAEDILQFKAWHNRCVLTSEKGTEVELLRCKIPLEILVITYMICQNIQEIQ